MSRIAVLDRFSIGFSTLCLLHCLAVPVLVSVVPVFATFALADASTEPIPASFLASRSCRSLSTFALVGGSTNPNSISLRVFAS